MASAASAASATSAVSQLKYWREGDEPSNTNKNEGKDGATYLSYNVFLILSLFGGFFALDHLYLRSPMTFVAKFIVNLLFFGIWWAWDAAQALFNESTVRIYGLSIPGFGPKAIGAGVLAQEIPDKKHMRFFTYGLALIFGGLIGLDSFLVGQTEFGLFRLICTITIIFMPISIFEWAYKLYKFFFNTKDVVNEHSGYFGAVSGSSSLSNWFYRILQSILGPVIIPVTATIDKGLDAYTKTLGVVDTTLKTGSDIISGVGKLVDAASKASVALPGPSLYSAITTPALEAAKVKVQTGGSSVSDSNLKLLPYTLVGTVLLIISSGLYKNFFNVKPKKDDVPPKP
jgi:TM2 domain-containing membrane protein YozV